MREVGAEHHLLFFYFHFFPWWVDVNNVSFYKIHIVTYFGTEDNGPLTTAAIHVTICQGKVTLFFQQAEADC